MGHASRAERGDAAGGVAETLVLTRTEYAITLDIDWAPDWMIDLTASVLLERETRATWFVTHSSPAVDRLRERPDLFELGIHPNCLPGSSHGRTESEVLRHLMALVPEAVSMRTHGLYQSTAWLFRAVDEAGIGVDASLFIPHTSGLAPHRLRRGTTDLWRVPYFWEDDCETFEDEPSWHPSAAHLRGPGLKVFDFHPVHIALNTQRFADYEALKAFGAPGTWEARTVSPYTQVGAGPRTMLQALARLMSGGGSLIRELPTAFPAPA